VYSVLIQNKKTMESFHEFHPLFLETLGKDIVLCRWLEAGTTIDTALPELSQLTDSVERWRAIIVHVEDEEEMKKYERHPDNPYDFLINSSKADATKESPVPLIRLTHMLGGVPAPEIEYESRVVAEKAKVPRTIYVPKPRGEETRLHAELLERYDFNGKLPTEIIVITLRLRKKEQMDPTRRTWNPLQESKSSEFWRRNNYPGKCRFVVCDYINEGVIQKRADMFSFWTSVLLLATNDIDSSSLQAYRLYTMKVHYNKFIMEETFKYKAKTLRGVRRYINYELDKDIKKKNAVRKELPPYADYSVSVDSGYPSRSDVVVDTGEFKLSARSESAEKEKWRKLSLEAEEKLEDAFKQAERVLEERADEIRYHSKIKTEDRIEIQPLDRFQMEDVNTDLFTLYGKILEKQNNLPRLQLGKKTKTAERSGNVKNAVTARITKGWVMDIVLILLGLLVLSLIPAVLFTYFLGMGKTLGTVLVTLALLLAFLILLFILLKFQRHRFIKKIIAYNDVLEDNLHELVENLTKYQEFVGDVVSYARGKNYLELLRQRMYMLANTYSKYEIHLRATNAFLDKIARWAAAFYIPLTSEYEEDEEVEIDLDAVPNYNHMYTFETDWEHQVPFNQTGDYMNAPFHFIERVEIKREELYEDA